MSPKVYRIFGKDWSAETADGYELDCNYATEFVTKLDHDETVKKATSLEKLVQEFVDRVESGEFRSIRTYKRFKDALEEYRK